MIDSFPQEQKRRRRKTFCAAQIVASNISKALRVLLSRERNLKKTKFRPSRTPRAMKSKNMQTRYQLVHTYFINISTTNHRARAVRIHPSRAVFRKEEKFSVPLHFRRKPKKSSNARKQKTKERGISRSIHTRDTNYALSSLSREADNHRRRQKRMLYAYLRHFIFMSVVCFNEVEFRKGQLLNKSDRDFRKKREKNRRNNVDWNLTTSAVKCGERRYYSEGSRA